MKIPPNQREQMLKDAVKDKKIKILYFDIETSPMLVWTHYIGTQVSIHHPQIEKETRVITIQYMYEGDKKPKYLQWNWTPKNGGDDRKMIETFITEVLNADPENTLVIGQNHKAFDHKVLNWRANILELTPPIQDILKLDVLQLSRGAFKAPSHKLDFRAKQYGTGGKNKMEFQDWIDITKGNTEKLKKMITYGLKDITDLQTMFWKELPYYQTLPAKLEKILTVVTPVIFKPYCIDCKEAKQCKFDVDLKTLLCNRCGGSNIL